MKAASEGLLVERELTIAARPETVWELARRPGPGGSLDGAGREIRPSSGGQYRVEVIPGHIATGEFVEIDPPRRLVYTWGWEPGSGSAVPPGSTTVEFELIPSGDGTRLRFRHRDLPSAETAASHAHGWDHYFERLARVAAGGDPGVDPWIAGPRT